MRRVDEKATKAARARHEAGVRRLNEIFRWTEGTENPRQTGNKRPRRRA